MVGAAETSFDTRTCALRVLAAQSDPARFLSISEPLKLGRAEVIAADEDLGVLVRLVRNGTFFAGPLSDTAARIMAGLVPSGSLVSLADDRFLPIFMGGVPRAGRDPNRYELWAYEGTSPQVRGLVQMPEGFNIAPLGPDAEDVVDAHYALMGREGIRDHLARGWVRGGFDADGALVGFIGEHDEASMGMLEVFPEARRRGFAQALEAALIDELLATGRTPYCHVALDNDASRALQAKLGLRRVDTLQCWFEMPARSQDGA